MIIIAGVLGIGGFVAVVMGFMRSSDAYSGAVARAKAAPAVIDALGSPVDDGYLFTGNIVVDGPTGKAELAIPIAGPKAAATLYVSAAKEVGLWHFDRLVVEINSNGKRIELSEKRLNQAPAPAAPNARGSR